MKIASVIILLIVLVGCHNRKTEITTNQLKVPEISAKDTPIIDSSMGLAIDARIKALLMQYYSAGWMDGTNAAIELTNENNFTNKSINDKRKEYWSKMRTLINSKNTDKQSE